MSQNNKELCPVNEVLDAALKEFCVIQSIPVDENTVVAYSGVPGAFAEQAAVDFFGESCHRLPVGSFRQVMESLEQNEAQYGVLPIENSSAGNVESNYDLLSEYDMTIVGEQIIEVNQALLALPGTKLEQIRTVYSHPQGLMQCSRFLEQWDWHLVSMNNTAKSAKKVKEEQDYSQAAIASERAAKLYGLEILNPVANNNRNNATRFIILSKNRIYTKDANKIGITFGLPHESGSLYNVLGSIVNHNLNMTMIESRPIPGKQWEYYFYIEFIGNLENAEVTMALSEISRTSIELRILGNYHTT
ncbi:MAG: prephenate dehydratase [Lachnospiraceae bacterium]|nr:prephenate dehydratase [Lachnospiraceae bacterium]